MSNEHILHSDINTLPFSNSFKKIMVQNSLTTVNEILKKTVAEILLLPGVTIHTITELIKVLEPYHLASLLKHES